MSQLSQRSVIRDELLNDDLLLSSVIIDQVKKLRSFAANQRTEVDMSTLEISFGRDPRGLSIKTSALEAVAVGSEWTATTPNGHSLTGVHTVLTIEDRGEPDRPWILVDDGWSGRLDYFHRYYTRYVATGKEASV